MGFNVGSGNLIYRGAFRVPQGANGSPTHFHGFAFGGQAIGFNPYRGPSGSLFIVGHPDESRIAEISIPALKTGIIDNLNTATTLQNLTNVTARVDNYTLEETVYIGGLLVNEASGLVVSLYEYYDGDADATDSHYTCDTLNLSTSNVSGLFTVGTQNPGYYAGYMSYIPSSHTGIIGKKHLTGMCAVAVAARTSNGPGLFAFNAGELTGISHTLDVENLVYYPMPQGGSGPNDHPIFPVDSTNPVYNTSSQIRGVVWASGADNVLFFGSHGTGTWWYGSNGDFPDLNDPARTSKGEHAYPYRYQIWSYPVGDLLSVMSGSMNPWSPSYSYWELTLPYSDTAKFAGGVAFDKTRNKIYLSQLNVDEAGLDTLPIIHVFDVSGTVQTGSTAHEGLANFTLGSNLYVNTNVVSPNTEYKGASGPWSSGMLNHIFRNSTFAKPNLWLGLLSNPPRKSDTAAALSELSHGNGYFRANVTGNTYWSAPTQINGSGYVYNVREISFSAAQGNWGWISGWAILDNSGDGIGNILFMGHPTAKYIFNNDVMKFPTGSLQINIG